MFWRLWEGIKDSFSQFWRWVTGWINGAMQGLIDAFEAAWSGLGSFFTGVVKDWSAPFESFISNIEHRIAELKTFFGLGPPAAAGGGPAAPSSNDVGGGDAKPPAAGPRQLMNDPLFLGATPSSYQAPAGRFTLEPLEVRVTVDGNARVEAPKRIQPIDRGEMLARA